MQLSPFFIKCNGLQDRRDNALVNLTTLKFLDVKGVKIVSRNYFLAKKIVDEIGNTFC